LVHSLLIHEVSWTHVLLLSVTFSLLFFSFNAVIVGHVRFLDFHGESNARLARNSSVYGDPIYPPTPIVKTLSLVLFSAPKTHLTTLQNIYVDRIIPWSVWKETWKKLGEGWDAFVLAVSDNLHMLAP